LSDFQPSTHQLEAWLVRAHGGDAAAWNQLLRQSEGRLRVLASRLLLGFPRVRRYEDTDDVLQNAVVRLVRAVEEVKPRDLRDFLGLASLQIRRELLDLARHYFGPHGHGANVDSVGAGHAFQPAAASSDAAELEQWTELHRRVGELPDLERETFDLLYYQGLPQAETAAILGVSIRTVQRRWQSALLLLHEEITSEPPSVIG
jgi:RNA polymerase sigma-70 factor (ECF subfamily)